MQESVDAAWRALSAGESGGAAVAAAIRVMEESEYFNAGYGGYPNANGIVLLDAAVMEGTRRFVSLMNCRRIKYPTTYALDLLEQGKSFVSVWTHELMKELDESPKELQERYGWVATHEELLPQSVIEMLKKNEGEFSSDGTTHGTVGCVVSDADGRLFAGISTGGVNHKVNGRIGDAPMIGLGLYADNELCAMTTTGNGEALLAGFPTGFIVSEIRSVLRADARAFEDSSSKLDEILRAEFEELSRKNSEKGGGVIIIPKGGRPSFAFNTQAIPIALRVGTTDALEEDDAFVALRDGSRVRAEGESTSHNGAGVSS